MKFDYEELRSLLLNTNYYLDKYRKSMNETQIKMYLEIIKRKLKKGKAEIEIKKNIPVKNKESSIYHGFIDNWKILAG